MSNLFDGAVLLNAADLTPKQWAGALLISFRERGLAGAFELIRMAPPEVSDQLSAALRAAFLESVIPANDP